MMQYSLLDRRPEEECLDLLLKNNIGVLVRGALAQGLLIDKPARTYLDLSTNDVHQAAMAVNSLSDSKRSATQTAIRYVLQHAAVASAVVGVRNIEQLEEVVKASSSPSISDTDLDALRKSVRQTTYKDHR
jgi:aryl-alcohol dehydrogenase-like predicted oxidoreductase